MLDNGVVATGDRGCTVEEIATDKEVCTTEGLPTIEDVSTTETPPSDEENSTVDVVSTNELVTTSTGVSTGAEVSTGIRRSVEVTSGEVVSAGEGVSAGVVVSTGVGVSINKDEVSSSTVIVTDEVCIAEELGSNIENTEVNARLKSPILEVAMPLVSSEEARDDGITEASREVSRNISFDINPNEDKLTLEPTEREEASGEGAMEELSENETESLVGVGEKGRRRNEVSMDIIAVETSNSRALVGSSMISMSVLLTGNSIVASNDASPVVSRVRSCNGSVMLVCVFVTVGRRRKGSEVDKRSGVEKAKV